MLNFWKRNAIEPQRGLRRPSEHPQQPASPRTERDYAQLRTPQERAAHDRNLDCKLSVNVNAEMLRGIDALVGRDGWGNRSALVRSLIQAALIQRT